MSKQEVEYEGTVHCPIIDEKVTVLIGRRIDDYGDTESFEKFYALILLKDQWAATIVKKAVNVV